MTDITIIHASRGRPEQAYYTSREWITSAAKPGRIQYVLCIDRSDQQRERYEELFMYTRGIDMVCLDNTSAIQAFNRGAKHSSGNLLIALSDDFNTPPFHWDEALLSQLNRQEDYVVKTSDTLQPWIITLPIMDRKYYERFGYIYYPEYKHMFCDTELTHVGDLLNRKITLPITFPHNHYATGRTQRDAINIKNDATWNQGEALYLSRMEKDFGLHNPPGVLKCDKHHIAWLAAKGYKIEMT
jgi:hypothetical protein